MYENSEKAGAAKIIASFMSAVSTVVIIVSAFVAVVSVIAAWLTYVIVGILVWAIPIILVLVFVFLYSYWRLECRGCISVFF